MVRKLVATLFLRAGAGNNDACSMSSSSRSSTASSWQWPSCTQARTLSFAKHDDSQLLLPEDTSTADYKTSVNPAYFLDDYSITTCRSNSTASMSDQPPPAVNDDDDEEDEAIIRGLRSSNRRLFFEPESTTSSIVVKGGFAAAAFDGATAMSIDSADPYSDFRRSMEEMVMSHMNGASDWGWLEEMLGWYLKANGKKTHGLIVGAFVDLVVALASSSSSSATTVCSSSSGFMPHLKAVKKGSQIN